MPEPNGTNQRQFLPGEGSFVAWTLDRQRIHPTPAIRRIQRNYGPEGTPLFSATLFWLLTGSLIAAAGVVLVLVSLGVSRHLQSTLEWTGFGLWFLGGCLCIIGLVLRGIPCSRAGREHRGDRPIERR